MSGSVNNQDIRKFSFAAAIITLGMVFASIATSPLYVMNAVIAGGNEINELLIYGSLSCIFWTLTLQTTIKYVSVASTVSNKGEGGIFALFTLIKHKASWIAILTMTGASVLLANAVIMPAITVTSSVEGLRLFDPDFPVILVILITFALCFFIQQFGANVLKVTIGPIMVIWFLMLGFTGIIHLAGYPVIFKALNPEYAVRFLSEYPGGFILLGALFLCVTGAETLYSNLGQIGAKNMRVIWIFVKVVLIVNYFGQGAWLLTQGDPGRNVNPFYGMMPEWFLIPGIIISTAAAIIASQALIRGSYTLLSEAISLNFWPRIHVFHPTQQKGQVYIPLLNWFLWIACSFVVIFFRESLNMVGAYGLSAIIPMIITTLLLSFYLYKSGVNHRLVLLFLMVFLTSEVSFLIAYLHRVVNGGWLTIILASLIFTFMYGWYFGRKIKNRYITFADLNKYIDLFRDLSQDQSVPKTATNMVYIIRANKHDQVESKVVYSIFHRQPKRADTYWFLHIDRIDEPGRFEYQVSHIIPGVLIRIDFHIGFKVEPKINLYFKEVLEDLVNSGEIKLESSYDSLKKHDFPGDFKFILLDRIMPRDFNLSNWEKITLVLNNISKYLSISDIKALKLDSTSTIVEQIPITADQPYGQRIKRI